MSERFWQPVATYLMSLGCEIEMMRKLVRLHWHGDRVTGVHWEEGSRDADLVVLAIGVRPATEFLAGSGLGTGERGPLRPDHP